MYVWRSLSVRRGPAAAAAVCHIANSPAALFAAVFGVRRNFDKYSSKSAIGRINLHGRSFRTLSRATATGDADASITNPTSHPTSPYDLGAQGLRCFAKNAVRPSRHSSVRCGAALYSLVVIAIASEENSRNSDLEITSALGPFNAIEFTHRSAVGISSSRATTSLIR